MPKRPIRNPVIDTKPYFPKENWLPTITVPLHDQDWFLGEHTPPVMRSVVLASCEECGCPVEQSKWLIHIRWHKSAA